MTAAPTAPEPPTTSGSSLSSSSGTTLPAYVVPRLDQPARIWLLPAPQARWLASGLFAGPVVAYVLAFWQYGAAGGAHLASIYGQPWFLVWWILAGLLSIAGAVYRPYGRHLGAWAGTLIEYTLRPKRAVWKPVGRGLLWW